MTDAFGPEYVIKVHDPKLGLTGYLVIHNTALGPGKGGIRMTPGVNEEEVYRLAATMTWKNSLAGIPFGGAKAGLVWSGGSETEKKKLVQAFARALKPFLVSKYIAGPDVHSGEKEMRWFVEAVGDWSAATGKPADYCRNGKCGLPHELGSTGYGVAQAAKVAAEMIGLRMRGAKVAIHGFGNVGTFAYRFLTEMGAKVIALADTRGAIWREEGLEPAGVEKLILADQSVTLYPGARKLTADGFWKLKTDILIPASVTDVINDGNKRHIKTKLIVEAGNIPMRENIEAEFVRRGVVIVPDFVANSGGVISSYAEHAGYSREKMFRLVRDKITAATRAVMKRSRNGKSNPREAAMALAKEKVECAMRKRRSAF